MTSGMEVGWVKAADAIPMTRGDQQNKWESQNSPGESEM